MTELFTEKDVAYLRKLGWPHNITANSKFNGVITEDEWLHTELKQLDEEYADSQKNVDSLSFYKEVRQSVKDIKRLSKIFTQWAASNGTMLAIYEPGFSAARDAIERMGARGEVYVQVIKGKHNSKVNAPEDAAKQVIELWALSSGEPPTRGKGGRENGVNKVYPAGKCFKYVLDKLTEAYGGSINEKGFQNLLKQARTKHNSKSGI